jgi:hypothetical protein
LSYEFGTLEILNWQEVNFGSIKATFDVRFSIGITVTKFTVATSRGGRQCLNLPCWRHTDPITGQRTFEDVISFDDEAAKARFKADLMAEVDLIGGHR